MEPEDLPREIRGLQGIDMSRIGFEQDVEDAVERLVKKSPGRSGNGISREEFEQLKSNLNSGNQFCWPHRNSDCQLYQTP